MVVLVIVLLVLLCPLFFRIELRWGEALTLTPRLFGIPIRIPEFLVKQNRGSRKKDSSPETVIPSVSLDGLLSVAADAHWRKRALRAILNLFRRTKRMAMFRIRTVWICYGAGDPAKTALRIGTLYALFDGLYDKEKGALFTLQPDFIRARFEGAIQATFRISLIQLIGIAVGFLYDFPVRATWTALSDNNTENR